METAEIAGTEEVVVGVKETQKALDEDRAQKVFVARDADDFVVRDLLQTVDASNVDLAHAESMEKLGEACGIDVGAAAAAILKKE